jgi:predicted small secreted protein
MKERFKNRLFALAILALPLLIAACNSGGGGGAPGY